MIPIPGEGGGVDPAILILSNGQEVIGELKGKDDKEEHYLMDYPQVVHWWANDSQGNGPGYEFLPYVFGALIQIGVPINCKHVITKVAPDKRIKSDYRTMIEDIHDREENHERLKRSLKELRERGLGL